MRIAYLDCFSGISGDMFLGALIDAGVPAERLQETVAGLNVGARLEVERVERSGIAATKVHVVTSEGDQPPVEHHHHKGRKHGHTHGRAHEEVTGHTHEREAEVGLLKHNFPRIAPLPERMQRALEQEHAHEHGRGLKEIREIIATARLSDYTRQTALRIFQVIAEAEAKIHNTDPEKVHFHEVGAVDALADIVGAAAGAEALGVDEWVCSPLNVGGGTVECAHGTFPVPAPATVELLSGALIYSSGVDAELVTPTGAAIVRVLASRFAAMPAMKVEKSGYGAGTRELKGHPNVLRLTVGSAVEAGTGPAIATETVTLLEANLDDLNPQLFGYVMDRALAEGALDVFAAPIQMKKNRPGVLLSVLCRPEDSSRLAQLIFAETTTLGVRMREERRAALARRTVEVETPWGRVRMKVANLNGALANYAPEYEDCRRLAEEHEVPLKQVMQEAMSAYAAIAGRPGRKKKK